MFSFGEKSQKRLNTVHPYLQMIMNEVIQIEDITILDGLRDEETQNNYYHAEKSQLKYPNSRHNRSILLDSNSMSDAIDVAIWHRKELHIRWSDIEEFQRLARIIKYIASKFNIEIIHGGDWETFKDYPHWELKK